MLLPGLRPARERLGLSLRELAMLVDIGAPMLCRYENGLALRDPEKLQALADVLHVAPADLLQPNSGGAR